MRVAVLLPENPDAADVCRAIEIARRVAGDVVLGCPDGTPGLPPDLKARPTWWRELSRGEVAFANRLAGTPAPLAHDRYLLPCDGMANFDDCDAWIVAGTTRLPVAPVKPELG